jgi:hypothetical protein
MQERDYRDSSSSLTARIEEFRQRGEGASASVPTSTPAPQKPERPPEQLIMPYWPETIRSLPNELFRCELFNARNRQVAREYIKQKELATYGPLKVIYTGEELRQAPDADVMLQLVHMARAFGPEEWITFKRKEMLDALGWGSSKKDYDRLLETFTRLNATTVRIHSERVDELACQHQIGEGDGAGKDQQAGVAFSLISKFAYMGDSGKPARIWRVKLDRELIALFADQQFTMVDWEIRRQLSPFGKWLHSYLSSHRQPLPFKAEMVAKTSGSIAVASGNLRDFTRKSLIPALERLVEVGFLEKYAVSESGTVSVTRAPKLSS